MLFDQPINTLQQNFIGLDWLKFAGLEGGAAHFESRVGTLEVSAPAQDILRMRIQRGIVVDYGILSDPERLARQAARARLRVKGGETINLKTGRLELIFEQNPVRLAIRRRGEVLLASADDRTISGGLRLLPLAASDEGWLVSLALETGESIFGLGEKFGQLNRRGQLIESWNRDATGVNAELSYKNVPFAWSPRGWGVFVHTSARVIHGVGYSAWSHRSYVIKLDDPTLDLFLIFADSPAEMLEIYTQLTGRTALPPRWSYGAWMSRAFYQTADEIMDIARKLRQHHIPCDVLTLDGRAWHKSETRFDFTWDADRYPDPARFVRNLRALDYRLCLWEYSYLSTLNPKFAELAAKKFFLQTADGKPYIHRWLPPPNEKLIPHLQPSGLLDFTNPEAYAWFREMHRGLFEMGISVMKTDYGEAVPEEVVGFNGDTGKRIHNIYTLLYNRCTFEAAQKFGDRDGIVWGRSSWAGGQRYPVQWGGDPQGDWEGLAASIRGSLSWGMSGGAFYAHDIGGFYGPKTGNGLLGDGLPDPELYIRWTQAGILASHTRFHGTSPREPWYFGDQAEEIVRRWLDWRYRLIPYLQGCALEAQANGLPVMRSMALSFPQDRISWQFEEQYMLGGSLLVAPVVRPGGKVRYYLPAGRWYDLWEGAWAQGPELFERQVPIEYIPVFGREGRLLPLGPAVQHTGELKPELDLEEVWAFGNPQAGIQLPGLQLGITSSGKVEPMPPGVKILIK
jgi:alpha-D-xyloside xylohydrolase